MAVVRALREADLPATYEALEQVAGSAYAGDAAALCDILAATLSGDGATVVTVATDGRLLGVASILIPAPGEVELAVVWVTPTHRRRGLARAMLAAFGPLWADATIVAAVPAGADQDAAAGLLSQFAFAPVNGAEGRWRARRVRRTTGRASLAHIRAGE